MISPTGLVELQQLVRQLAQEEARLLSLGDPAHLAGDPHAIRGLADAHRRVAGALRTAQENGGALAETVGSGTHWQGAASDAFTNFWADARGRFEEVAANHDHMAMVLEGIAAEAAGFNAAVLKVLGDTRWWLGSAAGAVVRADPGETDGLVGEGRVLLSDLNRVLADVERFGDEIAQRFSVDLGVAASSLVPRPPGRLGGVHDPVAPKRPDVVINVPSPGGPNILINVPVPGGPGIRINVAPPRGPQVLINVPPPPASPRTGVLANKSGEGVPDPGEIQPGSDPPTRTGGGTRYPDPDAGRSVIAGSSPPGPICRDQQGWPGDAHTPRGQSDCFSSAMAVASTDRTSGERSVHAASG